MGESCKTAVLDHSALEAAWEKVDRLTKNKLWVMNNIGELRSKYPDKYIAYDEGKVLASAETSNGIFRLLRKKRIPDVTVVAVEFVPKEPVIWLL